MSTTERHPLLAMIHNPERKSKLLNAPFNIKSNLLVVTIMLIKEATTGNPTVAFLPKPM
jgi:hypothetical protein